MKIGQELYQCLKLKGKIMNNIEQNALRIAELIKFFNNRYCGQKRELLIKKFSSYDYLMPIVFECNNKSPYGNIFNISVYYSSVVIYIDGDRTCTYWYESEPEFIKALQLACIKYLELKNG